MKKLNLIGMDDELKDKLLTNQLSSIIHIKDYNAIEKALLIEELAKHRNCDIQDLAGDLGCDRKSLYVARKILDAPKKVLEQIKNGDISVNTVNKILYSLKDESVAEEVVDVVISNKLHSVEAEKFVARINNPGVVVNQLHSYIWRFNKKLPEFITNNNLNKTRGTDFETLFEDLRVNLIRVQDKVCSKVIFK